MTAQHLLRWLGRSSTKAPAVSVIIPVYNEAALLPACLESVMNQSLRDLEIILVDDCSRDQSREVLAQAAQVDRRIRVFANKQNLGPVRTRNRGLAKATGRFVHLTDADDILPQDALKTLLTLATHQCCDNVRGSDWWPCHRALISDYLKAHGFDVMHILDLAKTEPYPFTSATRLVNGKLS